MIKNSLNDNPGFFDSGPWVSDLHLFCIWLRKIGDRPMRTKLVSLM